MDTEDLNPLPIPFFTKKKKEPIAKQSAYIPRPEYVSTRPPLRPFASAEEIAARNEEQIYTQLIRENHDLAAKVFELEERLRKITPNHND